MPDMPRTKFNSPWTVANIEAELNGTKNARGALTMTEKLAQKVETSTYTAEIAAVANSGAKNFAIPFKPISTSDIIVTQNANGSYTFDCTNVAVNRVVRVANIRDLPSGAYTFSGTTGGSSSTYMLGLYNTSASAVKYQHTNAEETYTGNVSGFSLHVRVISGYSGTFTVYPMIRPSAITDPTYEPYALPNPTLTPAAIKAVDEGSKNKCKITAATQTVRNVTFTVDAENGTITVNGTANATDSIVLSDIITTTENMFLTGTPSDASGYNLRFGSSSTYRDTGSGVSIPSGLSNAIYFAFNSGTVFSNVVLKPMICTASDWAVSQKFVPYCPTLYELYQMILALQNGA